MIRATLPTTPSPDLLPTGSAESAVPQPVLPVSFAQLGLAPAVVTAAQRCGLVAPTAVQAATIPAVLAGADVRVCARTGSGKTAAYALPLLHRLLPPAAAPGAAAQPGIRALVLLPTRELAQQVAGVLRDLARALPWKTRVVCAVGGVSINPQMLALRGGADVLLATPGRLLDLVQQRAVDLGHTRWLVLDEADRLLDLGFAEEVQQVLNRLPPRRQNLLLSATFPAGVAALAESLLRAARHIDVAADADAAPPIVQRAIRVVAARRTALLRHLLLQQRWPRALVFVATRYATEHVADKLRQAGIPAAAFHGELSQGARGDVLSAFKTRDWAILVTTDLAARGLDVAGLPVVFNYDLPRAPTEYTHRIGRTGRAGQPGLAISLVSATTAAHWQLIEKRQGQTVALEDVPGFEPPEWAPPPAGAGPAAADGGGIKGRRPNKKDRLRAQGKPG